MTTTSPAEADHLKDQLCQRIDELEAEKLALIDENTLLRDGITRARLYAGESLPAGTGLTLVTMLERVLRGE